MENYFTDLGQSIGIYTGDAISSYVVAVVILAVFFVLGKIVSFILSEIVFKMAARSGDESEDRIIEILNAPIFYSVVLLGAYQSLVFIEVLDGYAIYFSNTLKSLAVIIWTIALAKIAKVIINKLGFHVARRSKSNLDRELVPLFKNVSSVVIWFIGIAVFLRIWNLNITPLLASAGIAGFAIAFSAQDTISHLFSGLSIYFDKPFRVGDRIQLDSGEVGDVLEIGLRSTRIKTLDETVVIIPNKIVASSRIVNYNKPKSKTKVKIALVLKREVDINKAKKAILDVLETTGGVEKEPSPSVYFTDVTDSGFKFLLVAWVANPKKQFEVKTLLIDKIYTRMSKDKFAVLSLTEETLKK
jgi:small-conductance mechanosensitive channel